MRASRLVIAILAAGLLLTGCVPAPQPAPSATPVVTENPTPTPTPEASVASSVVVSLDRLVVLDQYGVEFGSTAFAEGDATLAFVSDLMGSVPEPIDNRKFGMSYEWPGIRVVLNFTSATVSVSAATVAGLPIATTGGIHVGSTRAEVIALGAVEESYDGDGDGLPDTLGVEATPVPGTESLGNPGQTGTAYIRVRFTGDTVSGFGGPSGDYLEI